MIKKQKKIYICGNPLVEVDSLPLAIMASLKKSNPDFDFLELDPTENLPKEKDITVIDTIINIKDIMVIEDIDRFIDTKAVSLHDFDLGLNLKLSKKMGWLKNVKIIGIPPHITKEEAVRKISQIIASLS